MKSELSSILETDMDLNETVSFNWPKYRDLGVSYDVWMRNVDQAEKDLEYILSTAPERENFPLMHLRNEIKDENDQIIRVDMIVYGKSILVNQGVAIFNNTAVRQYVASNMLNSEEAEQLISKLPPELSAVVDDVKNGVSLVGNQGNHQSHLELIPVSSNDPGEIKKAVKKHFEKMGVDMSQVDLGNSKLINMKDGSIDESPLKSGPLDLSLADQIEDGLTDEPLPGSFPFLLPNPDPDEFN